MLVRENAVICSWLRFRSRRLVWRDHVTSACEAALEQTSCDLDIARRERPPPRPSPGVPREGDREVKLLLGRCDGEGEENASSGAFAAIEADGAAVEGGDAFDEGEAQA